MANVQTNQPFSKTVFLGLLTGLAYTLFSSVIGDLSVPLIMILFLPALKLIKTNVDRFALGILPLIMVLPLGLPGVLQCAVTLLSPCLILGRLALVKREQGDWYSLNRLTAALGLYAFGLCVLGLVFWYGFGLADQTFLVIQQHFSKLPLEAQDHMRGVRVMLKKIWPYVPGLYAGLFTLLFSIGVSLTQKNLLASFKPIFIKFPRPSLRLSDLYVPWVFWKVFAGIGLAAAICFSVHWHLGTLIFSNLSLALMGVFLLQGMAVITAFAKKQKNTKMFLVVFYAFVVLVGWMLIFVMIIGLFEPWLNLRSRIHSDDDSKKV